MVTRPIIAALVILALPLAGARAQEPGPFPAPNTEPPIVTPGRTSVDPPSDAIVLFNGRDLSRWRGKAGSAAPWTIRDGYVEVAPGTGDITTVENFGDVQLHIEWATPTVVKGEGQERGNSGVFLAGLYEVQVLDSYNNLTYADGEASAIYGQSPPLVNASRPPGEWQSYDIVFEIPRFKDGELTSPGYITVLHNGVLTQNHIALLGPTVHHALPKWRPHGSEMPLLLQDHQMLVRFRNIWIRPLHSQ